MNPAATPVLVRRDGPVAHITLNRPDALNALDFAMADALVAATGDVAADDTLAAVVIAGSGRHFMAGGDIRAFAGELARTPVERQALFQALVEKIHVAIEMLVRMPHPVVARVHGAVAGFGLSLMNACDLVVAADDAYFAAGYRNIALTPDGGGTWSLPRLAGPRRAAEILLLGERFDAQRAHAIGLVNRVVPLAELDTAVAAVTSALVSGPRHALRATKRLLRDSPAQPLAGQLQAEAMAFGRCSATADFVEGITAFTAKRAPRFN
ncbi:MAG: enoyl-CoA hydratase/isomerase family protein [Proteobacteria bacterium]|nr:enoyl-CoA hydratase/isomerase family protein [Pseudomonadota bacterium]